MAAAEGSWCLPQGATFHGEQPAWKGTRVWLKIQSVGHSQHRPAAAVVWKIPQSLMLGVLEQDRAGRGHWQRAMARRAKRDEQELSSAENKVINQHCQLGGRAERDKRSLFSIWAKKWTCL